MFTGLIEEVAVVERVEGTAAGAHLFLHAQRVVMDVRLGDSISVNGACLTVVQFSTRGFAVDVVPETLRRSTLAELRPGARVNLERALRAGARLGGHIVSGHVDAVGRITGVQTDGLARVLTIAVPTDILRYVVEKGSICLDGVSLTVMDVQASTLRVSIIPHTAANTTLEAARTGTRLNIECDILAKYVERLLGPLTSVGSVERPATSDLSQAWLAEQGFV